MVLIWKNRIYVDKDFVGIDKNNRHLQFVYSVSRLRELPDSVYLINRFAFGDRHPYPLDNKSLDDKLSCIAYGNDRPDPELVISKYHGYRQCGILIPNMYNFNELGKWNSTTRNLAKAAKKKSWKERRDVAFWRGQILSQPKCHRDAGNFARWQALALSRSFPDEFECDCLDGKPCDFRNDSLYPCDLLKYDATIAKIQSEDRTKHSRPAMPVEGFVDYKFLLNVPGTISGSYSRHLNVLWSLGSVVLLWDSPHVEFYYPALRDGVTHVSVNAKNVRDRLIALREDNQFSTAASLAQQAKRVHDLFLCPDCLAKYMVIVLRAYWRHFRLDLIFRPNHHNAATVRRERRVLFESVQDRLLEVQFSESPDERIPVTPSSKRSIPNLFLRPVKLANVTSDTDDDEDLFIQPLHDDGSGWYLSPWRPGKGA